MIVEATRFALEHIPHKRAIAAGMALASAGLMTGAPLGFVNKLRHSVSVESTVGVEEGEYNTDSVFTMEPNTCSVGGITEVRNTAAYIDSKVELGPVSSPTAHAEQRIVRSGLAWFLCSNGKDGTLFFDKQTGAAKLKFDKDSFNVLVMQTNPAKTQFANNNNLVRYLTDRTTNDVIEAARIAGLEGVIGAADGTPSERRDNFLRGFALLNAFNTVSKVCVPNTYNTLKPLLEAQLKNEIIADSHNYATVPATLESTVVEMPYEINIVSPYQAVTDATLNEIKSKGINLVSPPIDPEACKVSPDVTIYKAQSVLDALGGPAVQRGN